MTAIAVVMAPWGVLMAADGRMTLDDADEPLDEHTQKIFPILQPGRTLLYGLAGSVGNRNLTVDLRKVFRKQVALLCQREFDAPLEYIDAVCRPIAAAITDIHYFPQSNGKSNGRWKIAEVLIGGRFNSSVFISCAEFVHSYKKAISHVTHYEEGGDAKLCYGSQDILNHMYDTQLNPIPDSSLSQYAYALSNNPLVSQAERFAAGWIEACCSPIGRRLDSKRCKSIGGHIHVATVKPRSGFQWLRPPKGADGSS